MSQPSFAHVTQEGFSSFGTTLSAGSWALVDASAYDDPAKPLWNAPLTVIVKVRLKRIVFGLLMVIEGAGGAKGRDRNWDGCQKQLKGLLSAAAASNDPAKRDAAARLQKLLLLGAGEGQTQLRYQEEVDFGRKQLAIVAQGQAAQDVALLGIGHVFAEISTATDALATAIGHGTTASAPHQRKATATAACVTAFGWAAETLAWMAENGGGGPDRDLAMALHASLVDLVTRYSIEPSATRSQEASPPNTP